MVVARRRVRHVVRARDARGAARHDAADQGGERQRLDGLDLRDLRLDGSARVRAEDDVGRVALLRIARSALRERDRCSSCSSSGRESRTCAPQVRRALLFESSRADGEGVAPGRASCPATASRLRPPRSPWAEVKLQLPRAGRGRRDCGRPPASCCASVCVWTDSHRRVRRRRSRASRTEPCSADVPGPARCSA